MCSVHSYAEIYLAFVPAFAHHSSLQTALHHRTRHQSKTLLVKHNTPQPVLKEQQVCNHQTQTRLVGKDPALDLFLSANEAFAMSSTTAHTDVLHVQDILI